ncbi:MAG TPA: SMP-30/gluconolactonase/LRE family protein [Polyangia bacterium]|jgi:gluconolactonase|nr:SMP-30/gluconolactonase/LRE family protein [Polyangia bacterium]
MGGLDNSLLGIAVAGWVLVASGCGSAAGPGVGSPGSGGSSGAVDSAAEAAGSGGAAGVTTNDDAADRPSTGGSSGGAAGNTNDGGDASGIGGAAGNVAADAGRDAVAARPLCPPGPFEMPRVGASRTVCAGVARYNWSEGPAWVATQGAFYFTNFPNMIFDTGDIIKYTPGTGVCEIFIEGARCNGLAPTTDGNIVGACQGTRAIMKYDLATKQATTVASMVQGTIFGQPNDLIQHSNGSIYFSSPAVRPGRPAGFESATLRIDPMGAVTVVGLGASNGIALSPDERRLYVVGQGVWDLDIQGVPSNKRAFNLGGDGIAVDCAGNVYDNGGNISNPAGQRIGTLPASTNMSFGGADGKMLLLVANQSARVIDMNLPGLP